MRRSRLGVTLIEVLIIVLLVVLIEDLTSRDRHYERRAACESREPFPEPPAQTSNVAITGP